MILYKEQWLDYPSAIIDDKTTNKSALDLALLYKEMGIENYGFILALHNPELQGVDPFSKDLTQEQIVMIVAECQENPWYFFREIATLPASSGSTPIKFRLNRANVAMFWLFFNHITAMLIQVRQSGKSVSSDMLATYLMSVGTINTKMNLLTKDDSLRVANINRLKEIYNELPAYLQLKDKSDTNNTEKITINALGNVYTTSVAQPSIKGALKLGRGLTLACNFIDEGAFIKNIDVTLPALLAASGAARDNAKAAGEPYGNVFTTTAGYLNSVEGKYVYDNIYSKFMPWTEQLFEAKNEEELNSIIDKNTPKGVKGVLLEFNHRQLGLTDDWLRGKIADAMATGDAVLADFLNIWPEGNSSSPIPKTLLKVLMDSRINDPYTEITDYGYVMRWYITQSELEDSLPDRKIVISSDTSDAVGSDDITLVVRDVRTGKVLGVGVFNETNLITFSEWLASLFLRFHNMTMIIERRSSGVAIIDNLIKILLAHGLDPFAKLFNWVVDEKDEYPKRYEEISGGIRRRSDEVYIKYRKHFGYATAGSGKSSRDGLYGDNLLAALKYTGNVVHDKQLVDQIASLTVRNGRIDHKVGGHDDIVIAWMLGYWFLTKARNKIFYGIDNHEVLSAVIDNQMIKEGNGKDLRIQKYQLALKAKIDELIEILRKEIIPFKVEILTNKIKMMYRDIDTKYIPSFDIDTVINNIMVEKKQRNRY